MNQGMHWTSVALVCYVIAFGSSATASGKSEGEPRYRIAEGKGYPVCIDFLQNLNAFPPDEPPMLCEQKIHPTHSAFARPDWEEMEIDENLKLIYEAERLLLRFTPTGTEARPFPEWKKAFQERLSTGEAKPRLRRLPVTIAGNEETLIWYEPVVNQCETELERYGVAGGPGGHIFVLRTSTGELQVLVGKTQSRSDVLYYYGDYLYFTTSNAGFDLDRKALTRSPVWSIGLHAMWPELTGDDRYLVMPRCYYYADRKAVLNLDD